MKKAKASDLIIFIIFIFIICSQFIINFQSSLVLRFSYHASRTIRDHKLAPIYLPFDLDGTLEEGLLNRLRTVVGRILATDYIKELKQKFPEYNRRLPIFLGTKEDMEKVFEQTIGVATLFVTENIMKELQEDVGDIMDSRITIDSNILLVSSQFLDETPDKQVTLIGHELGHMLVNIIGGASFVESQEKLIRDVRRYGNESVYPILGWLEETRLVVFQHFFGLLDYAKRESIERLKQQRDHLQTNLFSFSEELLLPCFFRSYLNLGIIGFELGGEQKQADYLKRELKAIFQDYISDATMERMIKGPIAYIKENMFTKGVFYVPTLEEFSTLIELLNSFD